MTHQQEIIMILLSLPLLLLAGMSLGYRIGRNYLSSLMTGKNRPLVLVRGRDCRIVTEEEFFWLLNGQKIEDLD